MKIRACIVAAAAVASAAMMGGCVTTGYQRADQTNDAVTEVASRLDNSTTQVDAVIGAIDSVIAARATDLRPSFTKFNEEVGKTETVVTGAQSRAADMRLAVDDHLNGWSEETKTLSSNELKEASAARRDKARAAAEHVTKDMEAVKVAYDPFIAGLKDLKLFLGSDLTSRGLDAASNAIRKSKADAQELKKAIQAAQSSLSQLRTELASPSLPPAPPVNPPPAVLTK